MLASRSGSILGAYSAGSTGKGYSAGILGGIHWRAALARCSGLPEYLAGFTGKPLWRDTRRDPLTQLTGYFHWRAGYSAGSAGELLWQDTGWGRGVEASQTTSNLTTPSCRVGNKWDPASGSMWKADRINLFYMFFPLLPCALHCLSS